MIEDGVYFIQPMSSYRATYVVLDVPADEHQFEDHQLIQQWGYHGGPNQQWRLTNVGSNYYTIVSAHSEKALDVPGGFPIPGLGIQQYRFHGGPNQQWRFDTLPGGVPGATRPNMHRIYNRASELALDVPYGSLRWGVKIQQYRPHNGLNQAWTLVKVR
jgi:hypothetical protein